MTEAFGAGPFAVVPVTGPRTGPADMDLVAQRLAGLTLGGTPALDLVTAAPTAAFSRRDTLRSGFADAEALASAAGFVPVVRPVGGHLAAYDGGSLVLHLWAPHPEPRVHIRERFEQAGEAVATALRGLGVDARVGPVPGEYCDGAYSVNAGGRAKLAGTGQRITRTGFLFSAVVMVRDAAPAREVLTGAYRALDLAFRPETVGCVADSVPGITVEEVRGELLAALAAVLPGRRRAAETAVTAVSAGGPLAAVGCAP